MKEQSNNIENSKGISTSSPYAIQKVDNWNQIPTNWKNTKTINRVNFELSPFDKKFQSIFNVFLGNDELRPQFNAYFLDEYGITVTNMYAMAHIPADISKKGLFSITGDEVSLNFPDYKNILPKEFLSSKRIDLYKLLQFCNVAINYCNEITKQVGFLYNDENGEKQKIYFNVGFLIDIIEASIKYGYDKLFVNLPFNPSKSTLFSNVKNPKADDFFFLLMPIMANKGLEDNYTQNISAMDIEFGLELSCIFDFDKNEIINKDGSIVNFKLDYGVNPIFTDSIIKMIKSSLEKKPILPILENFKVQNNTLKVVNYKKDVFSLSVPNINIPDGLYYLKNNVVVKNEYADINDFIKDIDYNQRSKVNSIKINKKYFTYLIETAKLYIGSDDLRPTMTGINFKYDGTSFYIASTNANYLCRINVNENIGFENNNKFDFILPINNITTILDNINDDFIELNIYSSNKDQSPIEVKIDGNSFSLEERLIDGKYPIVNQVISPTSYYNLNLKKESILNAIKSKDADLFIKKNKKLDIKIAGKEVNGKLSIFLYSTGQNSRYSMEKIDEVEILNTDLHLENKEVETTNTCLLLMPVITNEDVIFAFRLEYFNDFIKPVNTDYFEISYSQKERAYIINEQFFKYKETFKKPVKTNKIIEKKIEQSVKKEQTPAENKSDLEYLNDLLSTSKDLLDLISDTGSELDIKFLKEKIEATKDLISLLQ